MDATGQFGARHGWQQAPLETSESERLRSTLARRGLSIVALFGTAVLILSAPRLFTIGFVAADVLTSAAVALAAVALVMGSRASQRSQALLVLSAILLAALAGMLSDSGTGSVLLAAFSIIAAVLLGLRVGIGAVLVGLSVVAVMNTGVGLEAQWAAPDPSMRNTAIDAVAGWLAFAAFVGLSTVTVGELSERAERSLAERDDVIASLTGGSIQGILVIRDRRALFVNHALAKMLGYASPEHIATLDSIDLLFAPHERERLHAYYQVRIIGSDAPGQYEVTALCKNGERVTLQAYASPTRWNGEPAVQVAFVDISERKRAEHALQASEAQFRAYFDNSPHAMTSQALDGRYIQDNRKFRELYGFWSDECVGKLPNELWPQDMADGNDSANRVVVETGSAYSYEMRFPTDERLVYLRVLKFRIVSDTGELFAIGSIGSDETDRKLAEMALTESREQFRDFAQASSDWFWEMGPDLTFTHVSEQDERPVDVDHLNALNLTQQGGGDLEDVRSDPVKWQRFWNDLLTRSAFRGFEFPVRDTAEQVCYYRISGKPIFDVRGTFAGYRGVGADVTEIVESQRQATVLREAIDHASEGVVLYSEDDRVVFTNAAYHAIYPQIPTRDQIPGALRAQVQQQVIDSKWASNAQAEIELHAKLDGLATSPTLLFSDEPTFANDRTYLRRFQRSGSGRLLCVLTDITTAKATERELERSQAELRELASKVSLAEESERRRIAIELHDGAVQNLGLARLLFGQLSKSVNDAHAADRFEKVRTLLDQSIRELRSLMSELSPPMLYELGLGPAIKWLAERFRSQHGLKCSVTLDATDVQMTRDISVLLFQTVRELLMNVVKHAGATSAVIEVSRSDGRLTLSVHDDGVGLDPDGVERPPSDSGGFGLFSVRERLRLIGGGLQVNVDGGTRVTVRVPLEARQ